MSKTSRQAECGSDMQNILAVCNIPRIIWKLKTLTSLARNVKFTPPTYLLKNNKTKRQKEPSWIKPLYVHTSDALPWSIVESGASKGAFLRKNRRRCHRRSFDFKEQPVDFYRSTTAAEGCLQCSKYIWADAQRQRSRNEGIDTSSERDKKSERWKESLQQKRKGSFDESN